MKTRTKIELKLLPQIAFEEPLLKYTADGEDGIDDVNLSMFSTNA